MENAQFNQDFQDSFIKSQKLPLRIETRRISIFDPQNDEKFFPESTKRSNLRDTSSGNFQDLVRFKRLSKNILNQISPGLLTSTHDEELPRQFYLSNHCELVASRVVSKLHRRHDLTLSKNLTNLLNQHVQIPTKTSLQQGLFQSGVKILQKHTSPTMNLQDQSLRKLFDQNKIIVTGKEQQLIQDFRAKENSSQTTQITALNYQSQVSETYQIHANRSKSIIDIQKDQNGQSRNNFYNTITADQKAQIDQSKKSPKFFITQGNRFKGFRRSTNVCGNQSITMNSGLTQISQVKGNSGYLGKPLPFNFNTPFIQSQHRDINSQKQTDYDGQQSQYENQQIDTINHANIQNQTNQNFYQNFKNEPINDKSHSQDRKPIVKKDLLKINQNSEIMLSTQMQLKLENKIKEKDTRKNEIFEYQNQLMFRKHDPVFKITENKNKACLPNFTSGKHQGGGGRKIENQSPLEQVNIHENQLIISESQRSNLLKTIQGGYLKKDPLEKTYRNALKKELPPIEFPLQVTDKRALKNTKIQNLDELQVFSKIKGKSPLNLKEEQIQIVQSRSPEKKIYEFEKNVSSKDSFVYITRQQLEQQQKFEQLNKTIDQFNDNFKNYDHPYTELEKTEPKDPNLNKNKENARQIYKKLERTGEQFMLLFDKTREKYRENIEVLNFQQQFLDLKKVPDFIECKQKLNEKYSYKKQLNNIELKNLEDRRSSVDSFLYELQQLEQNNQLSYDSYGTNQKNQNQIQKVEYVLMNGDAEKDKLANQVKAHQKNLKSQRKTIALQRSSEMIVGTSSVNSENNTNNNRVIIDLQKQINDDIIEYQSIIKQIFKSKAKDFGIGTKKAVRNFLTNQEQFKKIDQQHKNKIKDALISESSQFHSESDSYSSPDSDRESKMINEKIHYKFTQKVEIDQSNLHQRRLQLLVGNIQASKLLQDDPIFNFMRICDEKQIPSLQFLKKFTYYNSIVLINIQINVDIWRTLLLCVKMFTNRQISMIYIENCFIEEEYFPQILNYFTSHSELKTITFIKLQLGRNSLQAILNILKSNLQFENLNLIQCSFITNQFDLQDFLTDLQMNPNFKKISLIHMELKDHHLQQLIQIIRKSPSIKDIDISCNHFNTSGIIKFFDFLKYQRKINLANLSWNHLNQVNMMVKVGKDLYEDTLIDPLPQLCEYIELSSSIQHMDLSNTQLSNEAVLLIAQALSLSVSINSVHLSGVADFLNFQTSKKITEILNPIDIRNLLILDQNSKEDNAPLMHVQKACDQNELDKGKNILNQIVLNFRNDLLHKKGFIENNHLFHKKTIGHQYVLQRIIGHPEIDSYNQQDENKLLIKHIIDDYQQKLKGRSEDNQEELDQKNLNRCLSRWFVSEQCFICSKSRYFIPIFLKSEMQMNQNSSNISFEQNRQLMTLLNQNRVSPQDLEKDEPYIIGSITNGRLQRMKKSIEFLTQLDPNAVQVLINCNFQEKLIQKNYKLLIFMLIEKYLGCKPYFDRQISKTVEDDDCMYLYNDFVAPGRHFYYVFSSDGSKINYKAHFQTIIKPRKNDIEIRKIPKVEEFLKKKKDDLQQALQSQKEYTDKLKFEQEERIRIELEQANLALLAKKKKSIFD